jgi:hypothetical protein
MTKLNLLDELVTLARKQHPEANYDFLANSVFSGHLASKEQRDYLHLIELARITLFLPK